MKGARVWEENLLHRKEACLLPVPWVAPATKDCETAKPELEPDLLKKDSNDHFCVLTVVFLTISFSPFFFLFIPVNSSSDKISQIKNLWLYTWLRLSHFRMKFMTRNESIYGYMFLSPFEDISEMQSRQQFVFRAWVQTPQSHIQNSQPNVKALCYQHQVIHLLNTGSLFEMMLINRDLLKTFACTKSYLLIGALVIQRFTVCVSNAKTYWTWKPSNTG